MQPRKRKDKRTMMYHGYDKFDAHADCRKRRDRKRQRSAEAWEQMKQAFVKARA